jgi:hypothetical protein
MTALAGGSGHTVALRANHSAIAWGNNLYGQCDVPTARTNIVAVSAGSSHTLLLLGALASNPIALNPAYHAGQFSVLVQTVSGKDYSLEYKNSLDDSGWTALPSVHGNGTLQILTDPSATVGHRFYRVRQF